MGYQAIQSEVNRVMRHTGRVLACSAVGSWLISWQGQGILQGLNLVVENALYKTIYHSLGVRL